jgi:hypothetical protein
MTAAPADARPRALIVPVRVIAATVLAAAAVALLSEALTTSDRPTHAVIWGSLALAASAFALLCLVGVRRGAGLGLARWRLGPWILLWYGVAFGLATATWSHSPTTGASAEIALSSVLRALWLVTVGMVIWAFGYLVGPGRMARDRAARMVGKLGRRYAAEIRSPMAPWILYAIGIAARLASVATSGHFGYVGDTSSVATATGYAQFLAGFSLCAPLAVAAAAIQLYRERIPGARATLTVLFLSELVFGAAAGGKQSFVITVLAVAIPFSATRHHFPKILLVVFPLIFLTVVIPFNRAYRGAVRGNSSSLAPSQALAAAPDIFRQTILRANPVTALPNTFTYLLQRIQEIDSPAIIMQRTPGQIAFISPAQLVEAPAAGIVPRAIWPGKPILATGDQISHEYFGLPVTSVTSSAVTPVADLYRHGGWIPVIPGMFLLGCGVRLLDDILDVRANPHAIFLVLLAFPILVKNEVDWITLVAGIPSTVLIWLLAVALTFRARRLT